MGVFATSFVDGLRAQAQRPSFCEALERCRAKLGADHPGTLAATGNLAGAYLAAKQPDKGIPLLDQFLVAQRRQLGPRHIRLAALLSSAGLDLLKYGHYEKAEPILRECLLIRETTVPDDWTTFHARSMLGASLLGQHRYIEAEPLIVQGYEGMKTRAETIPPRDKQRLGEARERLVELRRSLPFGIVPLVP
jgi:hypothetical protein